jgi:hypothetical protein
MRYIAIKDLISLESSIIKVIKIRPRLSDELVIDGIFFKYSEKLNIRDHWVDTNIVIPTAHEALTISFHDKLNEIPLTLIKDVLDPDLYLSRKKADNEVVWNL